MPYLSPDDVVVVTRESLADPEPRAVIQSNIEFINALFSEHVRQSEISRDALRSYYVDYYLCEVLNGGFSQFVYNSRWDPETIALVREGLARIGAPRHAELFGEGEALATARPSRLQSFFRSAFFGTNKERDRLDEVNERFTAIEESESLEGLNASWLRSRPDLIAVPERDMETEVRERASRIEDLETRKAEALAAEPRYMKLIRALCAAAGHSLQRVTAGDPTNQYEGKTVMAWHFITDKGHHYMVDLDDNAIMFVGKTREKVIELPVEGNQ
jgi:hypothetical protein